ncbi:MAG: InlB B-repeat-containing protein, partial [Clostridia bacterium]|nr:InlB B-repeat-containing protein [Clostridia bacterium]
MKTRALALLLSVLMITSTVAGAVNTSAAAADTALELFKITSAVYDDGTLTVSGSAIGVSANMTVSVMLYSGVTNGDDPAGTGTFMSLNTYSYSDIMTGDTNASNFTFTKEIAADTFETKGAVYVGIKTTTNGDAVCYGAVSSYIHYDLNAEGAEAGEVKDTLVPIGTAYKASMTAKEPTRTGYDFGTWYVDDDCTTVVSSTATMPAGGVTVYAKWYATQFYNIYFKSSLNGTLSGGVQTRVPFGTTWGEAVSSLPTVKPNNGYTFAYWYPEIPDAETVIDSDLTFTAVFVPENEDTYSLIDITDVVYKDGYVTVNGVANSISQNQWDIAFTLYGNVTNTTDIAADYDATAITHKTVKFGDIRKNNTSYEFSYSFKAPSADLVGAVYLGAKFVTVNFDEASFAPVNATLSFDVNAEDATAGTITSMQVGIGAAIGAIPSKANPTRPNYTFAGWAYEDGTAFDAADLMTYAGATLYAQWDAKNYQVIFSAGEGGTLQGTTNVVAAYGTPTASIAPVPVPNAGYVFAGWTPALSEIVEGGASYTATFVKDNSQWHTVSFSATIGGTLTGTTVYNDVLAGTSFSTIVVPTPVASNGYVFTGWTPAFPETVDGNLSFTANFSASYEMQFDITEAVYDAATGSITVKGSVPYAQDQWNIALMVYADVSNLNTLTSASLVRTYNATYGEIKSGTDTFEATFTAVEAGLTGNVYVYGKYVEVVSAADSERVQTYLYFDKNANDAVDGATTETLVYINDEIIPALTTDEPTRENFDFAGWAADEAGTDIAAGTLMSAGGYTAYAKWDEHTRYAVSFSAGLGGTLSGITTHYVYAGTAWTDIAVPTPVASEGYTFTGWNTTFPETVNGDLSFTANFSKGYVMPFDVTEAIYDPATGNVTVKGTVENAQDQWHVALFVVADVSDVATIDTAKVVKTYDSAYGDIKTGSNGFEAVIHVNEAALTGNVYVYGKYVEVTSAPDAERVQTYLYFDKNADDAVDGATTETTIYINEEIIPALTSDEPTRNGYDFIGWAADAEGTAIAEGTVISAGGYTAYAKWERNEFTVTFEDYDGTVLNSQSVAYGNAATAPANPVREGYTFIGWDKSFDNIVEDITVTAQYEINKYTVTFVDHDGAVLSEQTVEHGTDAVAPADPEWEGHSFVGWEGSYVNVTEDRTIKALYDEIVFTVTFEDYDGTVLNSQSVAYGNAATAPANPVREGYTFIGWDVAFDSITTDTTVTAQYEINKYTVSFVDYDGTELKEETVEHGSAATAPANPVREGYTFIGWDVAFDNITGDLTVTAQYEINKYTVSFVAEGNGSLSGTTELTVEYGTEISGLTYPEAVAEHGYKFVGWDIVDGTVEGDTVITGTFEKDESLWYTVKFESTVGGYLNGTVYYVDVLDGTAMAELV